MTTATSEPEIADILSTDPVEESSSDDGKGDSGGIGDFPRPVDLGEDFIPSKPEESDSADTKGDADKGVEKKTEEAPKAAAPAAPAAPVAPVAEAIDANMVALASILGIGEAEARSFGTTANLSRHLRSVGEGAAAANQHPALDEKLLSLDGVNTEDIDDNILKGLKQSGEYGRQVAAVLQGQQQQINALLSSHKKMEDAEAARKTDEHVSDLDRFVSENKSTHGALGSGPTRSIAKGSKEYEARITLAQNEIALKVANPNKTRPELLQMAWQALHGTEIKQKAADDVTSKLEKRANSAISRPRSAAGKPKATGNEDQDLLAIITKASREQDDGTWERPADLIGE